VIFLFSPKGRFWLAAILACVLLSRAFAYENPGMAGTLLPGPGASAFNPALLACPARLELQTGVQLPVGLVAILASSANPLLYMCDRARFISCFDLLTFYEQLDKAGQLLLNPPASPSEVVFRLEQGRLEVTDGSGAPLGLGQAGGGGGVALAGTALIPPPLPLFTLRLGPVYLCTGVFAGSAGHSLVPDSYLAAALESGAFAPDSAYSLRAAASLAAGLSQSVTYAAPFDLGQSGWQALVGIRLLGFYTAGFCDTEATVTARTNDLAVPSEAELGWKVFYLYPGAGSGGGARLDLGLAAEDGVWTFGLGLLNLAGFCVLSGYELTGSSPTPLEGARALRLEAGWHPALVASAAARLPLARSTVVVAADLRYAAACATHAGVTWLCERTFLRCGLGWEDAVVFAASAGLLLGPGAVEVTFSSGEAVFVQRRVYGLGLLLRFGRGGRR
jgi:hypothetical protein